MAHNFISQDFDQAFLLPPSMRDWLPEDHFAWGLIDAIDQFDLTRFISKYRSDGQGGAAYHPAIIIGVLFYSYSVGIVSSRKISRTCETDVAFRIMSRGTLPDHSTISRFRAMHRDALSDLFVDALRLCDIAGLVAPSTIALDGTMIRSAASMNSNTNIARLEQLIEEMDLKDTHDKDSSQNAPTSPTPKPDPRASKPSARRPSARKPSSPNPATPDAPADRSRYEKVAHTIFDLAEDIDQHEDDTYGTTRGDEPPPAARGHQARRQRMKEAKAYIDDAEATQQHEYDKKLADWEKRNHRGGKPKPPTEKARYKEPKVNLTDPDSRTMKTSRETFQGYNAQAIANEKQIILSADVCNESTDWRQLIPMLENLNSDLMSAGITPEALLLLADAGYCTEENLEYINDTIGLFGHISTMRKDRPPAENLTTKQKNAMKPAILKMHEEFSGPDVRHRYKQRSAMIEPVFAGIKTIMGFTRFTRHGLTNVKAEWRMLAAVYNLRKLHLHLKK